MPRIRRIRTDLFIYLLSVHIRVPLQYYYEFGSGTVEPLVEELEFSLSVDEYTHEYYT
jgi:hypothetical protein